LARLRSRPSTVTATLGVPAYFYPYPGDPHWAALTQAAPGTFLVMTPDNGPGVRPDPNYLRVLETMRAGKTLVYGYVDSAYAVRDVATLLAETSRYEQWYGVGGIFVDQVAATPEHFNAYHRLSEGLRERGLRVALNPGQPVIDPAYLDLADQVAVFEGTHSQYLQCTFPRWMRDAPADKLWHLVYEVDSDEDFSQVARLAGQRNAGTFFATDGRMPNPWDRLPPYWPRMVGASATSPNG
jgi:hypothetical protein